MTRHECKAPDCNCDGRGCWAREQNEAAADRAMYDATVEAVARAFCKRMGLAPDRKMPGDLLGWEMHTVAAREAIAMHLAVQEVLG